MNDLTEQWKKGELPEGKYWVKYKHWTDTVEMLDYSVGLFLDIDVPIDDDRIEQVLAPVPSYDEWKNFIDANTSLFDAVKMLNKDNFRLEKQNAQLKELLKECELWFTGVVGNMNDKNVGEHNRKLPIGNFEYIFKVFSQKINEVLNADKA